MAHGDASVSEAKQMAEWQAEGDAHTLSQAKAITQDADRMKAAEKAAKRLAKEAAEEVKLKKDSSQAMTDLSKGSLSYGKMNSRKKKTDTKKS